MINNHINWNSVSDVFYRNGMSFIHVNMRSLVNMFAEFMSYLSTSKQKFTFIILTETWVSSDRDVGYAIPGYKSFNVYRENRVGGGMKVFFS